MNTDIKPEFNKLFSGDNYPCASATSMKAIVLRTSRYRPLGLPSSHAILSALPRLAGGLVIKYYSWSFFANVK